MEESHHDIVHFNKTSVAEIVSRHASPAMAQAMRRHLGATVVRRITAGPILSIYRKEKFYVDLGPAFLEPSLDRVYAFHVNPRGLHPLSTFCEYENEVKAGDEDLESKIRCVPDLLEFDAALSRRFDVRRESLDKYHRSASFFFRGRRGAAQRPASGVSR